MPKQKGNVNESFLGKIQSERKNFNQPVDQSTLKVNAGETHSKSALTKFVPPDLWRYQQILSLHQ